MKKFLIGFLGLALLAGGSIAYALYSRSQAQSWESAIRKFEDADRANPPAPGSIVFTGSSSIALWQSLSEDMKPLVVVNRGFGGSQMSDAIQYAGRIVIPYRPRAVVLYAGDNDVTAPASKSPETVAADFKRFVQVVHSQLPDTWIYFISIKPSPSRWNLWPAMQKANKLIDDFASMQQRVQFIDVSSAMLNEHGEPRTELFRPDQLHLSLEGYSLWISIIKPVLLRRFG